SPIQSTVSILLLLIARRLCSPPFSYTTLFRSDPRGGVPDLRLPGGGRLREPGGGTADRADGGAGTASGAPGPGANPGWAARREGDRKSTRLNSSHGSISYAVFCLEKKQKNRHT